MAKEKPAESAAPAAAHVAAPAAVPAAGPAKAPPVARPMVRVQAIYAGTYPEPGGKRPIRREPGAVFFVQPEHLSKRWMRVIKDGENPGPPPEPKPVPQTTAPHRPRASQFPPVQ